MVAQQSKKGFYEWVAQRVTAVIILIYSVILLTVIFSGGLDYGTWLSFFDQTWMRIATVLATFSMLWHAWIGIWTVLTDYVKLACVRLLLQILVLLFLVVCGIWVVLLMCG